MKKLTFKQCLYSFFLLSISCFSFVACSDDETPVTPPSPPVEDSVLTAVVASVTVDPSGFCPLAARIRVNTSGGMSIRTTVMSKPNAVTPAQEHQFPYSAEPAQFLDVLGLYSNYTNQVKLAFLDAQGVERADTLIEIKVDSLAIPNVPQVRRVLKADVSRMEPGMNLALFTPNGDSGTSMPYMVDADGEIRYLLNWRNSEKMEHAVFNAAFSRMKDGNWLTGDNNTGLIHIVNPLGEWIRSYDFTGDNYIFHHEAREMENGNLICNMTKSDAVCADGTTRRVQDHIVEWNPETGAMTYVWDLANMMDTERGDNVLDVVPPEQSLGDWMHNNAITDCSDDYIATARFQGVFKYKPSGELIWILAPHRGWHEQYQQYLLTPIDSKGNVITDPAVIDGNAHTDNFDWAWGPHAAIAIPDDNAGNGKLHRILVYDNGVTRNFIPNKKQEPYSRAVIYEIDEEKMTVRQVWDFGKDKPEYFALNRANAAYLPQTGHVLFCPSSGAIMSSGKRGACIVEIDPATNDVVYHLELDNSGGFHRAYRLPLYPD